MLMVTKVKYLSSVNGLLLKLKNNLDFYSSVCYKYKRHRLYSRRKTNNEQNKKIKDTNGQEYLRS